MSKKLKYVILAIPMLLAIIGISSVAMAYTQTGPTTVCTTAQMANMSMTSQDVPLSTFTSDTGERYWFHSENWGDTFQKFSGTLDAPCGTLVWEKTRAQLFTNASSIDGQPWIISTYKDTNGLLAFIHIERAGTDAQKGRIGLAWSTDNGDTFTYLGNILSSYGDPSMPYGGFMQGAPYFIKDGYFYVYYTDNNSDPDGHNIGVARSPVPDVISAAQNNTTSTWYKYYNGAWNEAGLGGNFTNITNANGITHGSAAFSTYTNKYYLATSVAAWLGSQSTTWVKLWESTDGINWTLTKTIVEDLGENVGPNNGYQYLTIVDTDGTGNGTVGQSFYIYSGYKPYSPDKIVRRWTIDLAGGDAPPTEPVSQSTTPNLAFNKVYSSSSNYDENQTADKAFDGKLSTDWSAAKGSANNGQWLQVDFGTKTTFNRVEITEYPKRTSEYRIEYWNGSSWLTAYTGTTLGAWPGSKTFTFPAVNGSKARIYFVSGTNAPIIYDFKIYNVTSVPTNLALNKTYSSSSSWDTVQTAGKAFDGNLNSYWRSAKQSSYNGQWLEMDFGTNTTFSKAVLNEYGNTTTGYRIEYWNGSNWLTAYTGTTIGAKSDYKVVTFPEVTGSKARIYFTSTTGTPVIYEFELYDETSTPNLALLSANLKTYSSSSNWDASRTEDKAFDGNRNTDWSAAKGSTYNGQWLEVDFGINTSFNTATITEYGSQTTGYRIEYWNGSSWLTAYTGTTPLGKWPNAATVTFPTVNGSKAKIHFTSGTNIPIIYEFEIHNQIDKTAPVTTATVSPEQPDGQNAWYVNPVTVTFVARDDLSGVSNTEYSLDGGTTWLPYEIPITFDQDSKYALSYKSKDNSGNVEISQMISFNIDRAAPTINISVPSAQSYSDAEDLTAQFTVTDNLSGVDNAKTMLTLDGQDIQQDTKVPLYTLPLGSHEVVVIAVDAAGNHSSQAVTFQTTVSIDSLKALITRFTSSGWIDNNGIANSLQSKLDHRDLHALINEVQAQNGKHITTNATEYLLRDARALLGKASGE